MTGYERLLFVRNLVAGLPDERVDMGHYIHPRSRDIWTPGHPMCGTVACALGHAAMTPEMQAEGLSILSPTSGLPWMMPRLHGETVEYGYFVVDAFFGLPRGTARDLFSPEETNDRERFLAMADRVLAEHAQRPEAAAQSA
jgi:hypothetical protein